MLAFEFSTHPPTPPAPTTLPGARCQMRLMPQTRIALIREDGIAAAIFEEPKLRRTSARVLPHQTQQQGAAMSSGVGGGLAAAGVVGGSGGGLGVMDSRGSMSARRYNLMATQDDFSPFRR